MIKLLHLSQNRPDVGFLRIPIILKLLQPICILPPLNIKSLLGCREPCNLFFELLNCLILFLHVPLFLLEKLLCFIIALVHKFVSVFLLVCHRFVLVLQLSIGLLKLIQVFPHR